MTQSSPSGPWSILSPPGLPFLAIFLMDLPISIPTSLLLDLPPVLSLSVADLFTHGSPDLGLRHVFAAASPPGQNAFARPTHFHSSQSIRHHILGEPSLISPFPSPGLYTYLCSLPNKY